MKSWRSLYEILVFPLGIMVFAYALVGIGNILTNEAFASLFVVRNEIILMIAEACGRVGRFIIVYYPLIFLIRIVAKRSGSAASILSAFLGYVTYLIFTMYFRWVDLSPTAYSSILGLSITGSKVPSLSSAVYYPLQTGIFSTILISLVTLSSYSRSRVRNEYGFFAFISKDVYCVIRTVIICGLLGVGMAYVWPYVFQGIQRVIEFISRDTTNPINLVLYGVFERLLATLHLGTILRSPFWYGASGGSWANIAGLSIAGDVNIWTRQIVSGSLSNMTGRFITPYYVLNIFAVPGMIWAAYSIQTDRLERHKTRLLFLIATIISMTTGVLLPLEVLLVILCPLLYIFHLGFTGILFGVLHVMRAYIGFQYTGTNTMAVCPGTILELISYLQNTSLQSSILKVVLVGGISFICYFLFTRIYFNYLALDLFRTGDKERAINGTIEAVGGIDNVKLIHSSMTRLIISLYDPSKLDMSKLKEVGSVRVLETKAGFAMAFGAKSTMIRKGLMEALRNYVRVENR